MRGKGSKQNEYIATVVEYHPVAYNNSISFENNMLVNVAQYELIIKNANKVNTDIIVFPEGGMTGTRFKKDRDFLISSLIEVPDPLSHEIPWKQPPGTCHEVLRRLSLAAYQYNMYVVINLSEKYNCSSETDCPVDGYYFYNTNVVFDRQGCIIARYRKFNLFLEQEFSVTKTAELCTFKTDFGVTFGMFICFDILFENPAIRLLKSTNVRDIIFSTAWFSELPFLYAVGVQAGWSYSMDVNLLASDLNDPSRKFGGSGIYAGKDGTKIALMPKETGTKIFSARVPIKQTFESNDKQSLTKLITEAESSWYPKVEEIFSTHNNFSELEILPDYSIPFMCSKILEPNNPLNNEVEGQIFETHLEYSVPQFEGNISVRWSINKKYDSEAPRYRLIAYFGNRTFSGARTTKVAVCGLAACKNDSVTSCGMIPNIDSPVKTTFHDINIIIHSKVRTEGYIPITSNFSIGPLPTEQFLFSKTQVKFADNSLVNVVKMSSTHILTDVLSFAVYKLPSD